MQVTQPSGTVQYRYDGDGRLVQKLDADDSTTDYVGEIYEKNLTTGVETRRYYLGGQLVATNVAGTLSYLHGDYLQSTVSASNGATTEYTPYGLVRTVTGTLPTDRQFQGQQKQASTGLYRMGVRWYDPVIGLWTQPDTMVPDPLNPLTLNRFAFGLGNPLRYRDPSGHWVETAWDVANIAWDIYEVNQDPSLLNIGALVVDVGATVLPFVPAGVGMVVRAGKGVGKAVNWGERFAGASEEILSGVRRLEGMLKSDAIKPQFKQGMLAQLRRAEEYHKQGKLKAVEFTEGHNRYDLVLQTDEVVEVKLWRESYAGESKGKLLSQLQKYQGSGRKTTLEFVRTHTNPIGDDFLDELFEYLRDNGVTIARSDIRLVD